MVDRKVKIEESDFWCDYQINARNDSKDKIFPYEVGQVVTCCAAHLAEARVFPCRRSVQNIVYNPSNFHQIV